MMIIQTLYKKGLISLPKWLHDNVVYLTKMGSVAYGVSEQLKKSYKNK